MCPSLKSGAPHSAQLPAFKMRFNTPCTPLVPSTSAARSSAGPGCAAFDILAGLSKEFKGLAHGNAEDSGGKFRQDILLPLLALLNLSNTFWSFGGRSRPAHGKRSFLLRWRGQMLSLAQPLQMTTASFSAQSSPIRPSVILIMTVYSKFLWLFHHGQGDGAEEIFGSSPKELVTP